MELLILSNRTTDATFSIGANLNTLPMDRVKEQRLTVYIDDNGAATVTLTSGGIRV